jgi:integrase/recombinase XerD
MSNTQSSTGLTVVIRETTRLWRKHGLGYDQTKYVVEHVRRELALTQPTSRRRSVDRLDSFEVERLIQTAYRTRSRQGLMIKTLFLTGARVSEFVQVRIEDLHLDSDPPQIRLVHAKAGASRYVPILPSLAQELRTHLQTRRRGYLFESNRHTHYAVRTVQTMVAVCAREAGIAKRVYPHLLRHSIATILLDSGQMPIDQVQKFLGHQRLSTTQIYAETSVRMLGDNYLRALSSPG